VPPGIVLEVRIHGGVAACVIEVEMSVDHPLDVLGEKAGGRQRVLQLRCALQALVLDSVDVEELGVFLVAKRGVDQDQTIVMLHQKAAHSQGNPVPVVRLDTRLPQRSGDNTEHGTPVEALQPALEGVAAQAADLK
jgi:hypothetical protein